MIAIAFDFKNNISLKELVNFSINKLDTYDENYNILSPIFNMTGRVYLGPLITCLIFIMILSTNTVVYLPID